MSTQNFDQFRATFESSGTSAALEQLCTSLRDQKRYHELFEGLKMQVRHRLNLPLTYSDSGEELDEDLRTKLEDGLIDVCREVGTLLFKDGQIRDGYNYLRPLGDQKLLKDLLRDIEVSDDNADQFIEICFHESVDVKRGMELVLKHYGTCNSITTFESAMYGRARADRAIAAELLVDHLYKELKDNILSHIEREENTRPDDDTSIPDLMANRDWLTADGGYHTDTTHLSSTVRFARDLSKTDSLHKALELTAYGLTLDKQLQYPGEEPFSEMYESHRHYFNAILKSDDARAIGYFEQKARACNAHEETTMAIEVYIDLLHRVGRTAEAIEAMIELIPRGMQTTGFGPNLFDLCEAADQFETLQKVCRDHEDYLGFAIAVLKAGSDNR